MDLIQQVRQAADRISPLSFGIIGKSLYGGEPWAVGSGVFIAPYLGLTAKHVVQGTWNQFEPEWRRNKWPSGTELTNHSLLISQKIYLGRASEATWVIQEVSPVTGTDLLLLRISPQNEVAHQYRWGSGFLELQLLPPPIGSRVWVFGYPESRAENDAERADIITGDFQVELHSATVTAVEDLRRDRLKDFPGFEFAPGVKGGGSGGPVVYGDRLCGIACAGWQGESNQPGYAAALWPLIFAKLPFVGVSLGEATDFLESMKEASYLKPAVDLHDVESRALMETEDTPLGPSRKRPRLKMRDEP